MGRGSFGFSQVIGRLELLFGEGGALLYPACQSKLTIQQEAAVERSDTPLD